MTSHVLQPKSVNKRYRGRHSFISLNGLLAADKKCDFTARMREEFVRQSRIPKPVSSGFRSPRRLPLHLSISSLVAEIENNVDQRAFDFATR